MPCGVRGVGMFYAECIEAEPAAEVASMWAALRRPSGPYTAA
jgi:hypothetical protein